MIKHSVIRAAALEQVHKFVVREALLKLSDIGSKRQHRKHRQAATHDGVLRLGLISEGSPYLLLTASTSNLYYL